MNIPLSAGTSRAEYRDRFLAALREVEDRFSPDFIFISSGFDVLEGDPLGGLEVEPEDLFDYTRAVMDIGERHAEGRLVTVLEGGYVPERVGAGTVSVLRAMAGLDGYR